MPEKSIIDKIREEKERKAPSAIDKIGGGKGGKEPKEPPIPQRSPDMQKLLEMNARERFNLDTLNALDFTELEKEAQVYDELRKEVAQRAAELGDRVRQDTNTPEFVRDILGEKTIEWLHRSGADTNWGVAMPKKWGGLFHESHFSGGAKLPSLADRLADLESACSHVGASGFPGLSKGLPLRRRAPDKSPVRNFLAEIAQAYLDDLALRSYRPGIPVPLIKLNNRASDIERRKDVNRTLQEIFPTAVRGRHSIIHPQRFPTESIEVAISVPDPRTVGQVSMYQIVTGPAAPVAGPAVPTQAPDTSPWDRTDVTKEMWPAILRDLKDKGSRLDPPPADYREKSAYIALRHAILDDEDARKAFKKAGWRDAPRGLRLVCQLLLEGTLVPDAETDGEYLEVELGHLQTGKVDFRPEKPEWSPGSDWRIVKTVGGDGTVTYTATRAAGGG